mmetsp:Transcript_10027/g.28109  ORF Transcript_10027/g.28109 Transcript_10027/m.28109 type:complete len:203 (+) Transcript_10027:187-795(+)
MEGEGKPIERSPGATGTSLVNAALNSGLTTDAHGGVACTGRQQSNDTCDDRAATMCFPTLPASVARPRTAAAKDAGGDPVSSKPEALATSLGVPPRWRVDPIRLVTPCSSSDSRRRIRPTKSSMSSLDGALPISPVPACSERRCAVLRRTWNSTRTNFLAWAHSRINCSMSLRKSCASDSRCRRGPASKPMEPNFSFQPAQA